MQSLKILTLTISLFLCMNASYGNSEFRDIDRELIEAINEIKSIEVLDKLDAQIKKLKKEKAEIINLGSSIQNNILDCPSKSKELKAIFIGRMHKELFQILKILNDEIKEVKELQKNPRSASALSFVENRKSNTVKPKNAGMTNQDPDITDFEKRYEALR